jgi:Fe-S-cluster containining protein
MNCSKKCDECCRWLTTRFVNTPEAYEYIKARNLMVKEIDDDGILLYIPNVCPKLKDGRCTIYDHRPKWCMEYDCEGPFLTPPKV